MTRLFPMLDGPPIPWENAEVIYKDYSYLYSTRQTLERIAQRGGFSYGEIAYFSKLADKKRLNERTTKA